METSFLDYLAQLWTGLMVLLSGLFSSAPDSAELYQRMDQLLTGMPQATLQLSVKTDDAHDFKDVDVILKRFTALHFQARVVQQRDRLVTFELTGPVLPSSMYQRLLAPGRFSVSAMASTAAWQKHLSPELLAQHGVAIGPHPSMPMAVPQAPDRDSLAPLVSVLKAQGAHPFVSCSSLGFSEESEVCLLQCLDPELQITSNDITQIALESDKNRWAHFTVTLSPDGASRFADLTARNVNKLLPLVLDDEALCLPKVLEPIPGGKLTFTSHYFLNRDQNSEQNDAQLLDLAVLLATLQNPPLVSHWEIADIQYRDGDSNTSPEGSKPVQYAILEQRAYADLKANGPSFGAVLQLLEAQRIDTAAQVFQMMLLLNRTEAIHRLKQPAYGLLNKNDAVLHMVNFGVPPVLKNFFDEGARACSGKDMAVCALSQHSRLDTLPGGEKGVVSVIDLTSLYRDVPFQLPPDSHVILFRIIAGAYVPLPLPVSEMVFKGASIGAVASDSVLLITRTVSFSHQTYAQFEAFDLTDDKQIKKVWREGGQLESTCLAEDCDDEDYNGLMEIWLTDFDGDGIDEIAVNQEDNCDPKTLRTGVYKRDESGKMLPVAHSKLPHLEKQFSQKINKGSLMARHQFLLLHPKNQEHRIKMLQNVPMNHPLWRYHDGWLQRVQRPEEQMPCHYHMSSYVLSEDTYLTEDDF